MRTFMMQIAVLLCMSATLCLAQGTGRTRQFKKVSPWVVSKAEKDRQEAVRAKAIAVAEVEGEVRGANRIRLNGATGGWEVKIRTPDKKIWKVVIDRDTGTVREKELVKAP